MTLVDDLLDYHILWIFAVKKHRYRNLGKYDQRACERLAELREKTATEGGEPFLKRSGALTVAELKELGEDLRNGVGDKFRLRLGLQVFI